MTHELDERLAAARAAAPRPVTGGRPPIAPAWLDGRLLRLSGQIATAKGELVATGRVGDTVDLAVARACARQCAVNLLTVAQTTLGGLAPVRGIARLRVYVASHPNFTDQHLVADAATELLHEVLGEIPHVRTALGVVSLPRNSPVEVDAELIVDQDGTDLR